MEKIFFDVWKLAKPYYESGRIYDIPHIKRLMPRALELASIENLNPHILIPIAILHDVGYSQIDNKNPNIKALDTKKIHMEEGSKISQQILKKINYNQKDTQIIIHFIENHDNWAFGDNSIYKEHKEFSAFTDLDFLWVTFNYWVFYKMAEGQKLTPSEFLERWMHDEKLTNRPFCSEYTKSLWGKSIKWIEAKVKNGDNPTNKGPIFKE